MRFGRGGGGAGLARLRLRGVVLGRRIPSWFCVCEREGKMGMGVEGKVRSESCCWLEARFQGSVRLLAASVARDNGACYMIRSKNDTLHVKVTYDT